MKVAYANVIEDPAKLSGVTRKVAAQYAACRKAKIDLHFHLFSYHENEGLPEGVFYHLLDLPKGKAGKLSHQGRCIADTLSGYDVVILRSLARTPLYWLAFRHRRFALVTEHHTKLFDELWGAGRKLAWAVSKASSRMCMDLSEGMVCMTGEIAEDEIAHGYPKTRPVFVIPNGITVDEVKQTGFVPFDGQVVNVAFIASTLQPWHGLDRLAAGLSHYEGAVRVNLHVIGDIPPESVNLVNPRVGLRFHGVLTGKALDRVMGRMSLGVSTLALFRKNMNEACSLKTREYMARGLPFVYAYDDPDLPNDSPFCRKLENADTPVFAESLIAFAADMAEKASRTDISGAMRGFAETRMDWAPKMRRYMEVASEIAATRLAGSVKA